METATAEELAFVRFWSSFTRLAVLDGKAPISEQPDQRITLEFDDWLLTANGSAEERGGVPPFSVKVERGGRLVGAVLPDSAVLEGGLLPELAEAIQAAAAKLEA
jgi:hypothetical protein